MDIGHRGRYFRSEPVLQPAAAEPYAGRFGRLGLSGHLIAMITQIGYALGLLFIVPLGDLYRRKKIILVNFLLLVFALLTMALAESIYTIWAASLVTGVCSMIPQIFVPIASNTPALSIRVAMWEWSFPVCLPEY